MQLVMALNCKSALVTLASQQFDGLVDFYCKLLNLRPVVLMPNRYAEFELPGVRLGIFQPKEEKKVGGRESEGVEETRRDGGMALCLEVEDLEAAIAHLTDLGYPPPGKIRIASHGREIYAYDPEGNWLILHEGVDN